MRLRVLFAALVVAGACLGPSTALASGVWSAPTKIVSSDDLDSVSCTSATFCVGLDFYGDAVTYNGTSWTAPTNIGVRGNGGVSSDQVSCASVTFCAAVGGSSVLTYNGTSWTAPTNIGGNPSESRIGVFLSSVSCSSATFCAAVGGYNNADAFTYNGTSWTAPTNIDGVQELYSVSCPSATFCAAVGADGAVTYNGTSWSALTNIDGGGGVNGLDSVSCASATFCVAVDQKGNALTYNGTSWSAPTKIAGTKIPDPAGFLKPFSVSCPSATFCAAVDSNGIALTYNGTSWTAPTNIRGNAENQWFPVSCSSATFCAALVGGDALTYTTATAGEANASVQIEKFKVTTSSLVVTVKTSRAGTVTITGPGLKKTTRTVAAGARVMTVALTTAGKAERAGRKKIKLSVSLKTSRKTVSRAVEIKL
jgi:hypothetical protein